MRLVIEKSKRNFYIIKYVNFLSLLIIFFNPLLILANAGPPSSGGSTAGVPSGLEKIYILRERLTIDMRPLGALKSNQDEKIVWVEAVYEIENRGEEIVQDLIFAVGSENVEDFQFWIDDQEIGGSDKQIAEHELYYLNAIEQWNLPEDWQPPRRTPWKNGASTEGLEYYPRMVNSVAFKLTIPAGRHTLKAKYKSQPGEYLLLEPMKAWQFAYILAPVREWAGFGGLDITLLVPDDWETVTSPELKPEDKVLKGSFDNIPGDFFTVTTRAPEPLAYKLFQILFMAIFCLALLGYPAFLIIYSRRKYYKYPKAWLIGIGLSVLWCVILFAAGVLVTMPLDLPLNSLFKIPEAQMASYPTPLLVLIMIILSPFIFIIGIFLWMNGIYSARKKNADGES